MHDETLDGMAVIEADEIREFVSFAPAEARFDRDGNVAAEYGENVVKEGIQFRGGAQEARTLAFGNHGAGGAAEIEVDFAVAHREQRFRCPAEVFGTAREKLRHDVESRVGFNPDVF